MGAAAITVMVAAVVSSVATVAVVLFPQLHFAYAWPSGHLALETAASLIALLAVFLVFGRMRRRAWLSEWALACALATIALSDLFFVVGPAVSGLMQNSNGWAVLFGRSLGAVLFALAAFAPRRRLHRPGLALGVAAVGAPIALLLGSLGVRAFGNAAPLGLVLGPPPQLLGRLDLDVPAVLLALQIALALLYALATLGFLARSRKYSDEFYGWLAIAAVLNTFSRINYLLYPSLGTELVYTGDVYRFLSYVVLLFGSMREISFYWHALSAAAAHEERRRIARDLHDGLAQELAYLWRNLAALDGSADDRVVSRLREAVERARTESRLAVSTLTAPTGQTPDVTLADAAREVAERFHIGLELDLAREVRLPPARLEALVRIACEAVRNAARHSGAERAIITLKQDGEQVRMRVSDFGCGFDASAPHGGFGLISMAERASSVGGELRISSSRAGSTVEVAL